MNETTQVWALGTLGVIAYVAAVLWFIARFRRRREEEKARDDLFVSQVIACVRNGSVESIDHISDLYSSHFSARVDSLTHLNHLSHLLRKSIAKIASASEVGDSNHKLIERLPSLRQYLSANEERVQQEELRLPFSDAPHPERQLLEDILEMTKSDKELVRTKLSELGKAIRIRQDTVDRLGTESHQSLVWAKWGLAGTVVFSVVSIVLAIAALK